MSVPCVLGDPGPLREALIHIVGRNAELTARLEPVEPLTVETKGALGRSRTEERYVGLECAHYVDIDDGSGRFEVTVHHPAGWPALAAGPPTPVGSRLTLIEAEHFILELALPASPAQAAAESVALAALLFADGVAPAWQVSIVDNT